VSTPTISADLLSEDVWRPLATAHRERAEQWTLPHLERRDRGQKHPVEDFLFEYYDLTPGRLSRWHPGLGVTLQGADEYAGLSAYVVTESGVTVDAARLERRRPGLTWTRELLARTAARPGRWGCFGLHEWAMVYRSDEVRHPGYPLRLGDEGTAEVVDSHQLACTHVDAFRFFTPPAVPLNTEHLTRERQLDVEQPGCLHVGMDLYKIAHRMLPFVEATIVLDTFELARDIRLVDMRASPYDLTALGHAPIPIETPEGKATYVRHQRDLADRAAPLRARLLELCDSLLAR